MIRPIRKVFQSRFRGFRIIDLGAFGCLAVLVLSVYAFKANQGGENARMEDVDDQIASEQRQIRILQAQLAHLEAPERLEKLAVQYLDMAPPTAKHETSIDALIDVSREAEAAKPAAAQPVRKPPGSGTGL